MRFNKPSEFINNGFLDESDDFDNINRNSPLRSIVLLIGVIISIVFMITCISVFFTHDVKSVLYALLAMVLQKCIQGSIEYRYGMKATAFNSYLWAVFGLIFGFIFFTV